MTVTVSGQKVEKTLYFGKSHYTATYNDALLCVTQQMGGWLLYDISSNPLTPELLYEYDCRAGAYDSDRTGYEEYQQPTFLSNGDNVFLAIAGYDRDLVRIYDVTVPKTPTLIYECNLRNLWNGNLKDTCLHTMGIACSYPYIYCTVAPYPGRVLSETMTGVATVDISDLNKITVSLSKMPNADRTENASGEPAPASIAICDDYIIMDNYDKGISVWDISDKSNPVYIKTIETDTKTCSVVADNGRIFCGSTLESDKIKMYRLKKENALTGIIASVKNFDVQKADKATTLAGYGITDTYNKTYLDKALNNKLIKMPFDTVPAKNSPNYITSGTVYNSVNTLNQSIEKKADKATSLEGYGITDAYDKTYINRSLNLKLDKMPFDTVPAANSPNYITSGTLYNSVNTLNQSIEKKADKATSLEGYGITDAYDKTYINRSLNRKLDKMPFDTEPTKDSPYYITSGTLYNSVNTLNQSIATKYDSSNFESGTGSLTPGTANYEGCEGSFNYVKNGKAVTVSVNITKLIADKTYTQMAGLPFRAINESKYSSIAVYSTTNKLRNVRLDGTWLFISTITDKFAENEKINFIITYIRR